MYSSGKVFLYISGEVFLYSPLAAPGSKSMSRGDREIPFWEDLELLIAAAAVVVAT